MKRSAAIGQGLGDALVRLQALARPEQVAGMARFGMNPSRRLGASVPALRGLGKSIGRDHSLALQLVATRIPDAQILAAYVAEPKRFTAEEMDAWVVQLDAWDSCDQACGNAFDRTPLAWGRIDAWAGRPETFVRRAAFALLASLVLHDKAAANAQFLTRLYLIEAAALDDRNFVKKAVNWALRQIGKRNAVLREAAVASAHAIARQGGPSARWIAGDALRELTGSGLRGRREVSADA